MAYKKYIKRNGKIYGPYIYHSKRVDGKVVSEYKGPKKLEKDFKKLKLILTIAGMIIIAVFLLWILLTKTQITGNVVAEKQSYLSKSKIFGNLNLVLQEGELIPINSKVFIKSGENSYEYNLSELISSQQTSGNYYLENVNVQGSGEGFGFPGNSEDAETIFFQYKITKQNYSPEPEESLKEDLIEIIEENKTEENKTEENKTEENKTEKNKTISVEENTSIIEPPEENESSESISDSTEELEQIEETPKTTPITGAVIGDISNKLFKITGNVVNENIQADVSKDKEFKYKLKEDEKFEIIYDSVRIEEGQISQDNLKIEYQDNFVIVSTVYSKQEKGFGKDYLSLNKKAYEILLGEELFTQDLEVKIIYQDKEIAFYSQKAELAIQTPEEPEKILLVEEDYTLELNQEEIDILKERFGEIEISTSAQIYRDKTLVIFKISDYQIEHYYDGALPDQEITDLIEQDKIRFLKDFAREFLKQEQQKQPLQIFTDSEIIT
ncbi:MAG: hypothetical protein U9Q99_02585 [Nanoarchaeota archaeon]|nr:hypothetical protein [Nanoarchaeota archaeon]